ncbi:hypothetical protein [Nostoc sp.]|uniref:hypothetical protein n=1 Tax=Nostoc sp. TaxID=1180 RepID=UPI002FF5658D
MKNLEAKSDNSESTQSQSQDAGGNGTDSKQSGGDPGPNNVLPEQPATPVSRPQQLTTHKKADK